MSDKKRMKVITEQRMGEAEFRRRDWIIDADEGTTVQDIMEPGYWSLVCRHFSPMDRIDVRLETGDWMAELIVLQVGMSHAVVSLLHHYSFVDAVDETPKGKTHEVIWRGTHHKWGVRRLADQEVIQSNFQSKEEANTWLTNHERTVATT